MYSCMLTGDIVFGLVNVPVRVHAAIDRPVEFHQYVAGTTDRIGRQWINKRTGVAVHDQNIARGYEADGGPLVTFTDEELAPARKSKDITVSTFVGADEIDPLYYSSTYYLSAAAKKERPYALLVRALDEAGKVAIAEITIRGVEHLAAIRSYRGRLVMHTLHYVEAVRDIEQVQTPELGAVSDAEHNLALDLIESLSGPFRPSNYGSRRTARLNELIRAKRAALPVEQLEPETDVNEKFDSLIARLERSVA